MKNTFYRQSPLRNNRFFMILGLLLFIGCKSYSFDTIPYLINGDFVMEENAADYSICGMDIFLLNKSEKEIRNMTIVFFLFDQDGEPAYECRSKIAVELDKDIAGGESCSFCISLDKFMNAVPQELLMPDYLYLAKIVYEDGSSWEDPYGLVAFK